MQVDYEFDGEISIKDPLKFKQIEGAPKGSAGAPRQDGWPKEIKKYIRALSFPLSFSLTTYSDFSIENINTRTGRKALNVNIAQSK